MVFLTNDETSGPQRKFPEIILDVTLAELLREESDNDVQESLCNIKPCADPRHSTVPLNKKFLMTSTSITNEDDLAHLQLENVSYLLSFWAGNMEVCLMGCEGWTSDDLLARDTITANAHKAFSILNEAQRPRPITFTNKSHFLSSHSSNSSTKIRWGFAVDFAEDLPSFVSPETQYLLNSKRWLAECPLRSANDRILDPEGSCETHRTISGLWYFGGSSCAECESSVASELTRLRELLESTPSPFVLKLTQSLGSVGTMLVRSEKERGEAIEHVLGVQREALRLLTEDNARIRPVSLVLSEFLPGETNALNFFVRRDGSVRFLGACHQLSTRVTEGGRQCTALACNEQGKLEGRFRGKLDEIGRVLKGEGYFGPCGADIMEAEDGTQYVIDLNVRTTTSLILGCLQGHCEKRGFNACAVYECVLLGLSREVLEEKFGKDFEEGRFILLGNTRLGKKDVWAYPVVLAGEDQDTVKDLGARILKFEAGGKSEAQDAGGA